MKGKVVMKHAGGYDPKLGKEGNAPDPTLEMAGPRDAIQPRNLKLDEIAGFGKAEVEQSARALVQFFQEWRNGFWGPFSFTELVRFYNSKGWNPDKMLFGLIGIWFDDGGAGAYRQSHPCIIQDGGNLFVTQFFAQRVGEKH